MIKLYILTIVFNLGGLSLAVLHLMSMIKKHNITIESTKTDGKIACIKLTIISITPIINMILGIGYIIIASGMIDDEIIKKLNKK